MQLETQYSPRASPTTFRLRSSQSRLTHEPIVQSSCHRHLLSPCPSFPAFLEERPVCWDGIQQEPLVRRYHALRMSPHTSRTYPQRLQLSANCIKIRQHGLPSRGSISFWEILLKVPPLTSTPPVLLLNMIELAWRMMRTVKEATGPHVLGKTVLFPPRARGAQPIYHIL